MDIEWKGDVYSHRDHKNNTFYNLTYFFSQDYP
jgi:hypothetical protein